MSDHRFGCGKWGTAVATGALWLFSVRAFAQPDAVKDGAGLRERVTRFHRLFYHQAPTEAQLDAMLGEPGVLPK